MGGIVRRLTMLVRTVLAPVRRLAPSAATARERQLSTHDTVHPSR